MSSGVYVENSTEIIIRTKDKKEILSKVFGNKKELSFEENICDLGFASEDGIRVINGEKTEITSIKVQNFKQEVPKDFISFVENIAPFVIDQEKDSWVEIETPEGLERIVYRSGSFEWIFPKITWQTSQKFECVVGFSTKHLKDQVNQLLEEGWELYGNMVIVNKESRSKSFGESYTVEYIQPMIKKF